MFRTVPLSIIRSFFTVHTTMVYISTYTIAVCTVKKELMMMDRGTVRNMQSFIPKNKLEKLVHLVGFIIRIYHDARSPECQIRIVCSYAKFCHVV